MMKVTVKNRKPLYRYPLILIYAIIGAIFSQDKRISERLPDYFFTYKSFAGEFLNQLLRVMGSPGSFLPQGIIIEPTNICNLRCGHCTAQAIDEGRGHMDYDFFKKIIDTNPQVTCLILSRNGEPLLNPRVFDMISYAKGRGIYVSIYTNGVLLSRENAERILDAGLDEISFSLEATGDGYEKNRHVPYEKFKANLDYLLEARRATGSRIKVGLNVANIAGGEDNIKMIRDAWAGKVDHIDIEPLMGGRAKKRETSCRTLWRNAVIRWDGIVLPCCIDMKSTLVMGDLKRNTLKEIFNSRKARELRKSHIDKRYPAVCAYCDALFG